MSTESCRWLFLLLFLATWTSITKAKEIRVVCYYTNWSVYRPGTAKFSPQNINPYLCTHLIYAFGGFTKENTLKPFDKYQDIEKGGYAKFTGLKTYNKNLKTMLAIGGWNEGSSRFSPMVANAERRKELVKNAIKFLRQNHFDGLDLDWEYPSFRDGGKARDRDNYAQLVKELREEFDRESEKTGRSRLLLTMAVPAGIEYINKGYDVPKLTKYLDWMNILSYDYHSAFEPAVNHHSPLFSLEEESEYNYDADLNIDYTIKHYLKMGAEPNKLVLGIPTYGRSYTLFNPDANEIGAPADGPGDMGDATRENGYLAYYEICENIKSQDWEVVQPNPEAMGPYAFKDNQWVGYDDDAIARKKAEYVAENGLGGIMFWSIDNDDFRGTCHSKPYPIIEAAKEALISAYGLTDENLISPPAKSKSKTRTRPTPTSKVEDKSVSSQRRRNRIKPKEETSTSRSSLRRKDARRTTEKPTYSSLELVTPSYTTPAPPSTPDTGGAFKCEDEGFYPHPKDCKKYFWCLSGPGELGIVAHQFTCPAGLYFNKAADSCDYTQNVLCNKKLSKSTPTTEAPTTTTQAASTSRIPPKITAATSRTTVFRTSTTTEPYEEEFEYEDDEVENTKNAEEDPRVIKELLDLIKKAGGIEELEKQLKIQEEGGSSDTTTPSSISKSLVERVLLKANAKKNSFNFINRNSRGPQNEGLKTREDKKPDRGRPQYTNIARQRPQKTEDEEQETKEEGSSNKKQPEYVNIRRARVSTTASPENSEKTKQDRNKILGEGSEDEDDVEEEEEQEETVTERKLSTPQYVSIRRQRPSTTEGPTTSKYTVIRRGSSTESTPEDDTTESKKRGTTIPATAEIDLKSKYKTIRRGTTTATPEVEEESATTENATQQTRGSTVAPQSTTSKRRGTTATTEDELEVTSTPHSKYSTVSRSTTTREVSEEIILTTTSDEEEPPTTIAQSTTPVLNLKTSLSPLESTTEVSSKKPTPILLQPRPFSIATSSFKPVTETSTKVTKVSEPNYKLRVRQRQPNSDLVSTTEKSTRTRAPSRFKVSEGLEPQTPAPIRSRTRFSTTTEAESAEDYDLNRSYRPAGIADLSSLTAVDFGGDRDLSRFTGGSRSRRIRPTTSTTEKPEEKLISRPPLVRKLPENSLFGKSRRVTPKVEDQVDSSSDTAQRVKAFTKPSPEETSTESGGILRNRKVIRRFRPTTAEPPTPKEVTLPKRLSRFSTIAPSEVHAENLIESASTNPLFHRRFTRPATRSTTETKSTEEDDINTEDEENIKLSESNIRENSAVNNQNILLDDGKKLRRKVLKRVRSKVDEEKLELNTEANLTEEETIPTETENPSTEAPAKASTLPNIIIRTRKIVRKLQSTEAYSISTSTTESDDSSTVARRRKVFRRIRPTTESLDHVNSTATEKTLFIRGRPFTTQNENTTSSPTSSEDTIKYKPSKNKYKPINRGTTPQDTEVTEKAVKSFKTSLDKSKYKPIVRNPIIDEEPIKQVINRSKYNTLNRGTTSTTTESYEEDYDDEEEEEHLSPITPKQEKYESTPKYRISRPQSSSTSEEDKPTLAKPETNIEEELEDEDNDEDEENQESTTENEELTTTTVRNYKNPILDRQKNRPSFVRPRISTAAPKHIRPVNKLKFEITSEAPVEVKEEEVVKKFVPKLLRFNRTEGTTTTAKTEPIVPTPIIVEGIINATTMSYPLEDTTNITEAEVTTLESTAELTSSDKYTIDANSTVVEDTNSTIFETTEDTNSTLLEDSNSAVTDIISTLLKSAETTIVPDVETKETTEVVENTTMDVPQTTLQTSDQTETVPSNDETTTQILETSSTSPTTPYIPRSSLRPIQNRPKFTPKKLSSVTTSTTPAPRSQNRFKLRPSLGAKLATPSPRFTTSSPLKNRFKFTPTTTERIEEEEEEEVDDHEEEIEEQEEEIKAKLTPTKPKVVNRPNGYSFRKTTEAPKVTEDLTGINTEAVKNRNKGLFSKKRKMNTPSASSTTSVPSTSEEPEAIITEAVTKPTTQETTEYLTTLHHIFAEPPEPSTEKTSNPDTSTPSNRVEKLIEVNRIVEVHDQNHTISNDSKMVDKVGVINRVTVVKIVDPEENEISESTTQRPEVKLNINGAFIIPEIATVREISKDDLREERRYDLTGVNANVDYGGKGAEIIDGRSHINIITPRPYYSTEASTIALQGLFQTDTPLKLNLNLLKNDEELLETDNSRYVNVRVLEQDARENKAVRDDTATVPIRVLTQDDYITMRAEVVEVTPHSSKDTIKIVPIHVEMSRKLINPPN